MIATFGASTIAPIGPHPEPTGDLHVRIVREGVELTGKSIKLDLKRRDTGAPVSSLDIPVSLHMHVDAMAVNLQNTAIKVELAR